VKSILGFLANLLLFLSISTLFFSIAAYAAFKLKAKRKPKVKSQSSARAQAATLAAAQPELLQQYVQPEPKLPAADPVSKNDFSDSSR
jgi:hypothetical protein